MASKNQINYIADMRGPAVLYIFCPERFILLAGLVSKGIFGRLFDCPAYTVGRDFQEIYIVLIPAILLTLCLDGIVFHFLFLRVPSTPRYGKGRRIGG